MKAATANQMINATIAAANGKGKAVWVVCSKWDASSQLTTSSRMTYREAVAKARAIREACGYANVERAAA